MNKNKQKVFLYARRSSDEGSDKQVQSIDDQIRIMKPIAKQNDYQIVEIIEESKSAKAPFLRPRFAEMVERIKRGEVDGILTWHFNRLSRNALDSGEMQWLLHSEVTKFIHTEGHVYRPEDHALLMSVEGAMSAQFSRDLGKSSKRGTTSKAEKGWMPGRAPLGYRNHQDNYTETIDIRPDKQRWDMVRKMWDLMLTGNCSPKQIQTIANEEWGFRTPQFKKSGGNPIALSTMYRMFNNEFYTGNFIWCGDHYEGKHKKMIEVEEFDKVQVLLGKEGKPRQQKHESAFTGLVTCGECSSAITCTVKHKIEKTTGKLKKYTYYNCTKKKKAKAGKCSQKPIRLEDFETQIDASLERYTILPQFQKWALEILDKQNDTEVAQRTAIYEQQQKEYAAIQRQLDNLTSMLCKELIEEDEFKSKKSHLKTQQSSLKRQLDSTEDRAAKWLDLTEETFHFARYARKAFVNGDIQKKRELFAALGQNYELKDKIVSIKANDWLVPIEKAYPELEAEYKRLELDKNLDKQGRNERIESLILTWGDYRELNPNFRYHKPA